MSFSAANMRKIGFVAFASTSLFSACQKAHGFFWNKKEPIDPQTTELEKAGVYMWGNGAYQARPDWTDQFANFTPKHIKYAQNEKGEISEQLPKFKDVIMNDFWVFGIDSKGNILRFENRSPPSFFDKNDPVNYIKVNDKQYSKDETLLGVKNLHFPGRAKKIAQTSRLLWVLSDNGDLYSSVINPIGNANAETWRKVPTINNLSDISTGNNHILMLTKEGKLFGMGNDNLGQCAGGATIREIGTPSVDTKITNPEQIAAFEKHQIKRIFSKNEQNYVETVTGDVFCFGSNNQMQLAHQREFESPENPHTAFFHPKKFNKYLDEVNCELKDIIMGNEFTLFHCRNKKDGNTQVFGTGHNLHGELATGVTKHINDFQKIELLSDYTIKTEKGEVPLEIKKISCGNNHCLAHLAIDSVLVWGSNEFGQIGNKKRSVTANPLIVSTFKGKKVRFVKADHNSNYVLAE